MAIEYFERAVLREELYGCRCKNNPLAGLRGADSYPKPSKCGKD